jgi:hypothetical protein
MHYLKYLFVSIVCISSFSNINANINPDLQNRDTNNSAQTASFRGDCSTAKGKTLLDINNVRATLLVGGDIWWDGDDGLYVVPKPPDGSGLDPVSSIFAGAVWIGGFDSGNNLKMAAQTYGTNNGDTDFWPGPLTEQGTVGEDTCVQWDRFFEVSGANIDQHIKIWQQVVEDNEDEIDPDLIPEDIKGWPAHLNPFFFDINKFDLPITDQGLAPFFDDNGNGAYEPHLGDYPVIDIRGCEELEILPQFGDQMIFWIYNDAGGVHTETNGIPIQMEIQVEAFSYATNDEINNMTFYRYKLINRALDQIDSCYFAMWVDPDLGCFLDDYVGCDTSRSMMYVYNSDALDGESSCNDCQGVFTYCTDIPILGVDYFRGPQGPKNFCNGVDASDGLCNPSLGQIEDPDTIVELGMSSFTYYNNGGVQPPPPPGTEDPGSAPEFYNYLSGSWRDGLRFTFGGNARNTNSVEFINYAFTEPPDDISGWSMCQEGLADGDRRTVQASGPFRLDPGALNELIIGAVWVPEVDYPCPSISKLAFADDIAQALFDNCFDITDGPDAPDACFIELDQEIILTLSNESNSNNFEEKYFERDLRAPTSLPDSVASYSFEGYKIYQLQSSDVTSVDFNDPEKARLIYLVDIKNGITEIYNWFPVDNPQPGGEEIWVPQLKVQGTDEGIRHTFNILEDQFGLESRNLINHKRYYYSVVAYGYNNFDDFDPRPPISGQRAPYIEGRRNIGPKSGGNAYVVIPRPIVDQGLNAEFGDGPIITRVEGIGVGNNFIDVSDEVRDMMFKESIDGAITYLDGKGPIKVKVFNPLDIIDGNFELTFVDESGNEEIDENSRWLLKYLDDSSSDDILSAETIEKLNEQTIAEYGFSISIVQTTEPGDLADDLNGAIGFEATYKDVSKSEWIAPIPLAGPINFIGDETATEDPKLGLANMAGGHFYPYRLCDFSSGIVSPAWQSSSNGIVNAVNSLDLLNNIDIVLTSDESKWSRCVVIETANSDYTSSSGLGLPTEGDVVEFKVRKGASVGSDSDPNGNGAGTGMSWFPGYAVDLETGKRLNIFFGENSTYDCSVAQTLCDNGEFGEEGPTGRDMIWNPSSQVFVNTGFPSIYNWYAGGQHYIYVTNEEYDGCAVLKDQLGSSSAFTNSLGVRKIKWVGTIMPNTDGSLLSYEEGIIPNDVLLKLRVDNSYKEAIGTGENNGLNKYLFTFNGAQASDIITQAEIDEQLNAINVVPNPYYGYSAYEINQFSNTVKITNLPAKCTISIYSLDGKFIRQYKRNEERLGKDINNAPVPRGQITPDVVWDLKNSKRISVASGVYLIHINADGLGERVIKWFGVARQFDPSGL